MKLRNPVAALVLSALALTGFLGTAQAATVTKNAGATTPVLSDFSAAFAGHPNKAGYAHSGQDSMFVESFRVQCAQGQKVSAANFSIQVRKLTQGPNRGDNDAIAFWDNGNAVFNTYLWTTADTPGTTKTLTFYLNALPPVGAGVITSPGNGMGLLADGDFSFSVQDDTSVISATLNYECSGPGTGTGSKKGMTWGVYPAHPVSGIATVACQGQPGGSCNAYNGDTMCTVALPVLCMKSLSLPNPVTNTQDPAHWSGNVIATTAAVAPVSQGWTLKSQVNTYCDAQFGSGWVVADFHAGTGWKFGAYGNVGTPGASRFWVNIKDQAAANCWAQ